MTPMDQQSDPLDDIDWLRARRTDGWSVTRIAAALGIDHRPVSAALRRAGLPIPMPAPSPYPQLHDVEWLTTVLATHSAADVAKQLGCSPNSVRYAARKYDVPVAVNGHHPPPTIAAKLNDRTWLARRRRDGATIRELAAELGTTRGRVAAASRAVGAPPVHRNGSTPTFPQLYDTDWVRTELATKTRTQVARDLGCSVRSVRDAAQRAGLAPTKTQRTPHDLGGKRGTSD